MTTQNGGVDPPHTWLTVFPTAKVVNMDLSFLTASFEDQNFSLTGSLPTYPSLEASSRTITLKVYSFECVDEFLAYTYFISD